MFIFKRRCNIVNVYHGSPISGLKEIIAKESTQQGKCVYASTKLLYAAIFGGINGMIVPPKIGGFNEEKIFMIERQENSFDKLKNKRISIYVLDGNNFNLPREHDEQIERTANENQSVLKEIIIDDVYEYLKENNVEFIEYKDRTKYGIPNNDTYLIQGILKTYLWKIEGRAEKDILFGNKHIEIYCEEFPNFREKIIYLKNIIDNLDDDLAGDFIKKMWNSDKDDFNYELINEYISYIQHNNNKIK